VENKAIAARTAQRRSITICHDQHGLFVGHIGEDSVYMLEEVRQAHKTNRDWHLDSFSSDNMSNDEDSKPSAVDHLDNNNNNNNNNDNGNNQGINLEDFEETEDYEPADGFHQKIINILAWTHEDLVAIPAQAVHSIMQHWDKPTYCWYCYNCNQMMVSTGQGEVWQCPACTYLDAYKRDNGPHWGFGVCERCENLGPAEMSCVTCLVSYYNQNTFHALKKSLLMYKDQAT
jgi:hypothetical protein